jgi:predicted  nucleic acid-binding Zn-ribbon protein
MNEVVNGRIGPNMHIVQPRPVYFQPEELTVCHMCRQKINGRYYAEKFQNNGYETCRLTCEKCIAEKTYYLNAEIQRMYQILQDKQNKYNELNRLDSELDEKVLDTDGQIERTRERLRIKKEQLEKLHEEENDYENQVDSANEKINKHRDTLGRLVAENNSVLAQLRQNRENRENRRKELEREVEELEGRAKQQIENIQQSVINETKKLSDIQHQQEVVMRMFQESLDSVNRLILDQKNANMSETYRCSICMDRIADSSIDCGHIFCGTCLNQFGECPICHLNKPEGGFVVRKLYFV